MNTFKKNLEKYAQEYYLMGNECVTKFHDTKAALANYNKAIELYPNFTDAWVRKGITLLDKDEVEEAEFCLNHAVQLRPMDFKAVYNRGRFRLYLNNLEGAIADLDKATSIKPQHAGAHQYFGDALNASGKDIEGAIQHRIAEELRKKRKK